jgi:hypothetical protein
MKRKMMSNLTGSGHILRGGLGSVFVCLLLFVCLVPSVKAIEDPARDAAESFLELLDAGTYQQAWWEGSELLHLTTKLDVWVGRNRVQRNLLGSFLERSIRTVIRREILAGFPDGVYAVLIAECRFENKQRGVEVITLGKDSDGTWRVISYDLR